MGFLKNIVGKVFDKTAGATVKKVVSAAAAKGVDVSFISKAAVDHKKDIVDNAGKNLVKGLTAGASLALGGAALAGSAGSNALSSSTKATGIMSKGKGLLASAASSKIGSAVKSALENPAIKKAATNLITSSTASFSKSAGPAASANNAVLPGAGPSADAVDGGIGGFLPGVTEAVKKILPGEISVKGNAGGEKETSFPWWGWLLIIGGVLLMFGKKLFRL